MKIMRRIVTMLTMAALLCVLLATAVLAAENGSLWVTVEQKDGTAARIVTDTTVTDGVIKVTYDSSVLTYESTEVSEAYVAMYAVNAEEAGTVLISWVAPGAYRLDGEAVCLITLHFSGVEESSTLTVTGTAHGEDGSKLTFANAPDTTGLAALVAEAEALDEDAYTEESYAALEKALNDARTVLSDGTATQAEVDAAEKALQDAMDALVEDSGSGATEETKDPGESPTTKPTAPTEDSGDNADTGDDSHIWVVAVIGLLSVVAIVVLIVKMMPKKGRYAK